MKNKQPNFQQLLGDQKTLKQIARSPDAQALADILTKGQNRTDLQKIAQDAASGDTTQLSALIQSITSTPEGSQLLQRLSRSLQEQ